MSEVTQESLNYITVAGVHIPIVHGDVGFVFDGDINGSILLYLIMKEFYNTDQKIYVHTVCRMPKNFPNMKAASEVITRLIEITGNANVVHKVHYDIMTCRPFMTQESRYIGGKNYDYVDPLLLDGEAGLYDYAYYAVNSLPPRNITLSFTDKQEGETLIKERNPHETHPTEETWRGTTVLKPLVNVDMKKIREIYKEHNLLETVFPLARSCQSAKYQDDTGHCGDCWWCKERDWAFGTKTAAQGTNKRSVEPKANTRQSTIRKKTSPRPSPKRT